MIPIPKNQLVWSFPPFSCKQKNNKLHEISNPQMFQANKKKQEVQPTLGAKMQPHNSSPTP